MLGPSIGFLCGNAFLDFKMKLKTINELLTIICFSFLTTTLIFGFFPQQTTHRIDNLNPDYTDQTIKIPVNTLENIDNELQTGLNALKPVEKAWCIQIQNNTITSTEINKEEQQNMLTTQHTCKNSTIHSHPTVYGSFKLSQKDKENIKQNQGIGCLAHGKITVTSKNNVKGIKCFNNDLQRLKVKTK